MSRLLMWLIFCVSASILAQEPVPTPSQEGDVMLAAVSRDQYMFSGGIGPSKWTGRGTVAVEPLARLTPSGEWKSLPCAAKNAKNCVKFAREYLSKPHTYTVVSGDGQGAMIHAAPATLSECNGYTGTGTYTDGNIAKSAIAASSTDFFADSASPQLLGNAEAKPILKALDAFISERLGSTLYLRFYTMRLGDQDLIVVQRTFADYVGKPEEGSLTLVFAIGTMEHGRLHVLRWKRDVTDEEEQLVGTIRLKSGRDFLITTVSDPESQTFRVYGILDGHLKLVYSGGGSSC